jgi:hypothetical protein
MLLLIPKLPLLLSVLLSTLLCLVVSQQGYTLKKVDHGICKPANLIRTVNDCIAARKFFGFPRKKYDIDNDSDPIYPPGCSYQNYQECPLVLNNDYASTTSCDDGSLNGLCFCVDPCPIGNYQNEESSKTCKSCQAGMYNDETGRALCKSCPQGYDSSPGSISCIGTNNHSGCAQGKYSSETGTIHSNKCVLCPPGLFSAKRGEVHSCSGKCSSGKYSSEEGLVSNDDCKNCRAGTFSTKSGASTPEACQPCPKGKESNPTRDGCQDRPTTNPINVIASISAGILVVASVIGIFYLRKKTRTVDDLQQSLLEHHDREQKSKEPLNEMEVSQILSHLDTLTLDMNSISGGGNNDNNMQNKFTSTKALITGDIVEAALGLATFLDIPKQRMKDILDNGEQAIMNEVHALDNSEISEWLNYIVNETTSEKKYSYNNGIRDKGRGSMVLMDFVNHENAKRAKLKRAHVIALRLYTTIAFKMINNPLRDRDRVDTHPLAATVWYIHEGIKKLRSVVASKLQEERKHSYFENENNMEKGTTLWRGLRGIHVTDEFKRDGGTEFAPMSTTSNLNVALSYLGDFSTTALILKLKVPDALAHGADLQWISVFPGEAEVLYPPLTFLRPTGRIQEVVSESSSCAVTVIEVIADMSA